MLPKINALDLNGARTHLYASAHATCATPLTAKNSHDYNAQKLYLKI